MQELYHEMHTLDRFEQDYRRQVDELLSLNLPRKGMLEIIQDYNYYYLCDYCNIVHYFD